MKTYRVTIVTNRAINGVSSNVFNYRLPTSYGIEDAIRQAMGDTNVEASGIVSVTAVIV